MNRPFPKKHLHSKKRDRSSLLSAETIRHLRTKNTLRLTKKRPPCVEKKILNSPGASLLRNIFFIGILQKAKNLVFCILFPFLPLFMPFSFSSPSHFHISFPKVPFSSQYTQNYPHRIPLIHGISRSYPPYPQPYARFPDICRKL